MEHDAKTKEIIDDILSMINKPGSVFVREAVVEKLKRIIQEIIEGDLETCPHCG